MEKKIENNGLTKDRIFFKIAILIFLMFSFSVHAEPAPNGVDLWEVDRLHFPDYGASTNFILNPSFEAGYRYWGYLCYAQNIVPLEHTSFQAIDSNEANSGSHSLRLKAISLRNPLGVGTFPIPVDPNTDYKLSFYAKGSQATSLKLNLWARGRTTYFLPGTILSFNVNDQWQRFTVDINQTEPFISIYFDGQSTSPSVEGSVWLDDVQLERGTVTTDFTRSPVAAQLLSSARGNFLEFGQDPNFNLTIQTEPDTNGIVTLSVEDFFYNNVFSKTYQFDTDFSGKSIINLSDLSSAVSESDLRGVFIVKGVFNVNGVGRPYTDYFRFSVMDFLDNTHKNKDIFNLTHVYSLQSGGPELDRFLTRERAIGFGSINYDFEKFANDLDYDLDSERMAKLDEYDFGYMGRPVLKLHDGVNGEISEQNGAVKMTDIKTMINPTSLQLLNFKNICTIKAQNRPWNDIWWFTGESNPGCHPLETDPNSFAKFLIATNQGIKAGNPQAKVLIEGGPWNLAPTLGTLWVERYIQDVNRINPSVQFDGAAAHHYRDFPETPDLDSDIADFLAMLDRNGKEDWPFYINEGGNYSPFNIPIEGISPYVVHSGNSWYMGPLSYHSGRAERISAAFSARNWLIGLKYQDRVECMEDFLTPNRYTDVDFTSRFYDKIPNTLGKILGNASFVQDIVFAPQCRGYLFTDDQTNDPIAVIWGYKESVDRWEEDPPVYAFDFSGQDVNFIDLMENEVDYPIDCNGRTLIPLSSFPLFIKGTPGTGNQLSNTIINYENGRGTPLTIMDSDYHNGSLTYSSQGFWYNTPTAIPDEWVETSQYCYSTAIGVVDLGSTAQAVNNTGELVGANLQYTLSADLGGLTGDTAIVRVYATENPNGTGNKVLLVEVSRNGNDADGWNLFTVSNTGSAAAPALDGYYIQVVLEATGRYDNIVVTSLPSQGSEPACCGDESHPYPVGDLNKDCYVNLQDIENFSEQWLSSCAGPGWCSGADLSQDAKVKFHDFAILAQGWMNCTDPNLPCSYNP